MPWSASVDSRRAAVWVIALACAASAAAVGRSGFDRPVAVRLLAPGDPVARLDDQIQERFGMRNPLVWVVAARAGSIWNEDSLAHVQKLTHEVLRIPGVIGTDVISISSPNVRDMEAGDDSMSAVYLMPRVPASAAEMARLRRRVEGNPNFNGTLVSFDAGAAMVVADFQSDADPEQLAAAALDLRDRHRDASTTTYVIGAPVLRRGATAALPGFALAAAALLLIGATTLTARGGLRAAAVAVIAAILALAWSAALLFASGALALPWSACAALPTALLAAALAAPAAAPLRHASAGAVMSVILAAIGSRVGPPVRDFALAAATGIAAAVLSGASLGVLSVPWPQRRSTRIRRGAALALVLLLACGLWRLGGAFGAFGYGQRYLPRGAKEDLNALAHFFPPPLALAVRARGEPGFVTSIDVIAAFERLTEVAAADPAVLRATSLADLVKMVHRAFSDDSSELDAIPRGPGVIGRYLALAYSPGFRHFVDRAFTESAIWVYLRSDAVRDLARVRATLAAEVERHPLPGVTFDVAGGDGARALRQAREVAVALAAVVAMLCGSAAVITVVEGAGSGLRFLAAAALASLAAGGLLGLCGVPIDLVSGAALVAALIAAPVLTRSPGRVALGDALMLTASAAAILSLASGSQLGFALAAALAGPALAAEITPPPSAAGAQCSGGGILSNR